MASDSAIAEKSLATVESPVETESAEVLPMVDKATEKKIIRKLDWHIVPMVMWIYLMNFMDRGKSASPMTHWMCREAFKG